MHLSLHFHLSHHFTRTNIFYYTEYYKEQLVQTLHEFSMAALLRQVPLVNLHKCVLPQMSSALVSSTIQIVRVICILCDAFFFNEVHAQDTSVVSK